MVFTTAEKNKMSQDKKIKIWVLGILVIPILVVLFFSLFSTSIPIKISDYISWKTKDYSMNVQHESQNRLQNLLNEKELEENYNDSTTESFCDFRNLIGYNNIFRSYTLQDARRSGSINQLIQQYNIKTIIDGDDNNIADIIQSISTNEGPYLIYGKDIGIKCSIIEALKTPKFWTLYNGYAQSYYNVYPKQMQNNPSLTVDVQETFKNELASSIELNSHNVQYLNLCKYTKNYLMKHGMTDQMIDAAIGNLNVR